MSVDQKRLQELQKKVAEAALKVAKKSSAELKAEYDAAVTELAVETTLLPYMYNSLTFYELLPNGIALRFGTRVLKITSDTGIMIQGE